MDYEIEMINQEFAFVTSKNVSKHKTAQEEAQFICTKVLEFTTCMPRILHKPLSGLIVELVHDNGVFKSFALLNADYMLK